MQKQAKGIDEGVARNSVVILDPLAASCYDTYAIFEPPIVRLQRELDPKKRAIFDRMGLAWDASKVRGRRDMPRATDGLPWLTMADLAAAYKQGRPPHEVLRERLAQLDWSRAGADPAGGPACEPSAPGEESLDWSRFAWSG